MTASNINTMKNKIVRIAQAHFLFALLFAVQIMVYDAWKLIQPETVLQRWLVAAGLLVVTSVVWYLARGKAGDLGLYKRLAFVLITADILVASFSVYSQRGMASRAVMLYAVPIIVAAILASRSALYTTAFLSIAAYSTTAVAYFVLNFNEGYKIELYGEVGFYSVLMLLLAALLWEVIRTKKT